MKYGVKSHSAVVIIFMAITAFTLIRQWISGSWHGMFAMSDFMAVPVAYISYGEQPTEYSPFSGEEFVAKLLEFNK